MISQMVNHQTRAYNSSGSEKCINNRNLILSKSNFFSKEIYVISTHKKNVNLSIL